MKQEGVDHDPKRARASPVWSKRTTTARSKKQQHSVVLLGVMLLLWLYHTYDRACMIPGTYHTSL